MVRQDIGGGVFAGSRPSRYVVELLPVPGTATLEPVRGVRLPSSEADGPPPSGDIAIRHPGEEGRRRSLAGWLVDIEDR